MRHNAGLYVRYTKNGVQVTTNRIEASGLASAPALRDAPCGPRKHLHRYLSEVEFKYTNRHLPDGERTVKLIQAAERRRLTYAE